MTHLVPLPRALKSHHLVRFLKDDDTAPPADKEREDKASLELNELVTSPSGHGGGLVVELWPETSPASSTATTAKSIQVRDRLMNLAWG